jgi:hypothetical protein
MVIREHTPSVTAEAPESFRAAMYRFRVSDAYTIGGGNYEKVSGSVCRQHFKKGLEALGEEPRFAGPDFMKAAIKNSEDLCTNNKRPRRKQRGIGCLLSCRT